MKVLAATGEAGAVLCDDEAIANRIRSLRYLGSSDMIESREPDLNHKVDLLQAKVLDFQLELLPQKVDRRQRIAQRYRSMLETTPIDASTRPLTSSSFFDFPIRTDHSHSLVEYLSRQGIDARKRPSLTLTDQPALNPVGKREFPVAQAIARDTVCLPMFSSLRDEEIETVGLHVVDFFKNVT